MKLSLTQLHETVFKFVLKGLPIHLLDDQVDSFLDEWLTNNIYVPAFLELRKAQHLGYLTVILSNSPDFLVSKIAFRFQVSEFHSTQYLVDNDGKLCNISHIMNGEDKAACVANLLVRLNEDKKNVLAFSDSYWDLPLLQYAGKAIVVNPDPKLKKLAMQFNWPKI